MKLLFIVASLYWIYPQMREIYIIYFLAGNRVISSLFTVWDNVGMPENYRFIMGYKYHKKEGILLAEIYCLRNLSTVLSIRFHKIFVVFEYQLK
jgi:hypothetical protein